MISSRTPEGRPNECPVCGHRLRLEPSTVPTADAPCPHCGSLVWFAPAGGAGRVVADFSGVTVVDSAALGRLLTLHRKCQQAGGRLTVRGVRPEVRELFQLTKLDRILDVEDDDPGAG
jgi:DNA-directed RNA polymerase subunit RPC12/RpoP